MNTSRLSRFLLPLGFALLAASCHDSGPTAPANTASNATLTGTVISGTSTLAKHPLGIEIGLGNVTVTEVSSKRSTVTDGSGNFTIPVRSGAVGLAFDRADIHAHGTINMTGSAATVTISITGANAVAVDRGHAGEEIEGLVQAVGASSITVLDQRLGAVVVNTDGSTLVRQGDATIPLSQIQVGQRVHVKALQRPDNTFLATEVLLQDTNVGGNREVSGSVSSVNSTAKSFVVSSGGVTITVTTDSSTIFKRRGSSASFSDVASGVMVDVMGILQSDGTIKARKVTIEG